MKKSVFDTFPVIETERLILRELKEGDVESLYDMYKNEKVAEHETFEPFRDIKKVENTLRCFSEEYKKKRTITWGITFKEQDEVIGIFQCEIEVPKLRADFGYDLRQQFWNKGVMSEVVKRMIGYTFEHIDVNRIESVVSTKNNASAKVLEKCGFTKEGILRERSRIGGVPQDMIMYSILKRENLKT